ncbi:MAG: radical SAM/SPASM domain-containing protein [Candidatus Competibacteraceae bacterium]|nr:MAG: radical SAM/SPASM domain-containing protein [Candidatus Competibacteraceae bacterium]
MNGARGRYLGTLDYYFKRFLGRLVKPGSHSAIPMPSEFLIDTGNVCNLRCPFCPTGIGRTGAPQGLMSLDTFNTILAKIEPYAYYLEMMNWGEPFVNPRFIEMVELAASKGIRTNFDSNLSVRQFSEAEAERIVRSGIWRIRGSIDGATKDSYLQYRRRGKFDRALSNLALLQRTREKLGSSTPIIEWQFLINSRNYHEIEAAKTMASEIGVDISFKLMEIWGESEWRSPFHAMADRGEFNEADWHFRAPKSGADQFFKPKSPTAQAVVFYPKLPDGVPSGCAQPFNRMTIDWNGKVLPCCMCYGDHFYVGDLLTQSIEEIWYGQELVKSRQFLNHYGPPQQTQSVCETGACALASKYIGEPVAERERRHRLTVPEPVRRQAG